MESGAGDEVFGSEDEEGDAGLFGEIAEAVPGRGGDLAELFERVELEVEDEEREVAIMEEEVGATEGFVGAVAADPEETGTRSRAVGGGVEGVAAVDEGEVFPSSLRYAVASSVQRVRLRFASVFAALRRDKLPWRGVWGLEEFGEDEGEAGGGAGGGEFGESAGGKGGQTRGRMSGSGRRLALMLMRFGKLLPQLLTQGLEV